MSFKKDVREALTEIKVELGKNTVVLQEHHVRSTQLEARVKPIEEHVLFVGRSIKVLMALIAATAATLSIIHFFSK